MLHAWRIGLTHPITGVPLEFTAPLPADFLAVAAAHHIHLPPEIR